MKAVFVFCLFLSTSLRDTTGPRDPLRDERSGKRDDAGLAARSCSMQDTRSDVWTVSDSEAQAAAGLLLELVPPPSEGDACEISSWDRMHGGDGRGARDQLIRTVATPCIAYSLLARTWDAWQVAAAAEPIPACDRGNAGTHVSSVAGTHVRARPTSPRLSSTRHRRLPETS